LHILGPEKQTILFFNFICRMLAVAGDIRWLPPAESISIVPNDATLRDDEDFAGGVAPMHDPDLLGALQRKQEEDPEEAEEEDPDVTAFLNKTGPVRDDVQPAPTPPPPAAPAPKEALPQPLLVPAVFAPQRVLLPATPGAEHIWRVDIRNMNETELNIRRAWEEARLPMGLKVLKEAADRALEARACQMSWPGRMSLVVKYVPCCSAASEDLLPRWH
jgi:hypothetical protein